jgi:hypothetical protein
MPALSLDLPLTRRQLFLYQISRGIRSPYPQWEIRLIEPPRRKAGSAATRQQEGTMANVLTKQSIETLIDLVEIKLGCMEIFDRDDRRAVRDLQGCLKELSRLSGRALIQHALPTPEALAAA